MGINGGTNDRYALCFHTRAAGWAFLPALHFMQCSAGMTTTKLSHQRGRFAVELPLAVKVACEGDAAKAVTEDALAQNSHVGPEVREGRAHHCQGRAWGSVRCVSTGTRQGYGTRGRRRAGCATHWEGW